MRSKAMVQLHFNKKPEKVIKIHLPASKSISNRLLILQALFKDQLSILNLATADDTILLQKALDGQQKTIDVGMAGTAFRFLTSYYSIKKGEVVLTGDERMKQRPIAALVDALQELGADINYLEKKGFPPLNIKGKELLGGKVSIAADVSSQFISSLLLIAPKLKNGLQLQLKNTQLSRPYTEMTLSILEQLGFSVNSSYDFIDVKARKARKSQIRVESDWSSAAFFYNALLVYDGELQLFLEGLQYPSIQGDDFLIQLYSFLGIKTQIKEGGVLLSKNDRPKNLDRDFDFTDTPDLVQAFLVSCAVMGLDVEVRGIKSLKIKETDRILAMQTELGKMGCRLEQINEDSARLITGEKLPATLHIKTYNDHRMAMAFAPLAFLIPDFYLEDIYVVSKSFPAFWEEIQKMGVEIS